MENGVLWGQAFPIRFSEPRGLVLWEAGAGWLVWVWVWVWVWGGGGWQCERGMPIRVLTIAAIRLLASITPRSGRQLCA